MVPRYTLVNERNGRQSVWLCKQIVWRKIRKAKEISADKLFDQSFGKSGNIWEIRTNTYETCQSPGSLTRAHLKETTSKNLGLWTQLPSSHVFDFGRTLTSISKSRWESLLFTCGATDEFTSVSLSDLLRIYFDVAFEYM